MIRFIFVKFFFFSYIIMAKSMQLLEFSPVMKFKNGALSGFFASVDRKPVIVKLEEVVAPLGVSDFSNKKSIILNIDEAIHNVEDLLLVQAAAKEHPECQGKEFSEIVKCSDKYGRQIKVNIVDDTLFFDKNAYPCSDSVFNKRCLVNILIEVNMCWIRGKQAGVSVKALQIRHLKDIIGGVDAGPALKECCV